MIFQKTTGTTEASSQLSGAASAGWNPPDRMPRSDHQWRGSSGCCCQDGRQSNASVTKVTIRRSSSLTLPQLSELQRQQPLTALTKN